MSLSRGLAHMVDGIIDAGLATGRIVGAVVLVRHRGALIYERAAGYADREAGTPMAVDTQFRLASLTKPLVAVSALALIEHGRMHLDDAVTRFLPDFKPRLVDGTEPVITIWHLLTHTAGFGYPEAPGAQEDTNTEMPEERYWKAGVSSGIDSPGMSMTENLRRIQSVPLYFPPGSGWRYGVATDVLGAVIAAVHGGTLGEAVSEIVTGPLSMNDTAFIVRDRSRLAVPYADDNPRATRMAEGQVVEGFRFSPARVFDSRSFQSGGAGMVGTAPDFMTFLETIRTGGAPILSTATLHAAMTNQVADLRAEEPGWGFGLFSGVLTDPEASLTPHATGTLNWGGAWGHQWFVDPAAELSATMCTNTAFEGCSGRFPLDIRDAIYAGRNSHT